MILWYVKCFMWKTEEGVGGMEGQSEEASKSERCMYMSGMLFT